MKRLLYFTLLLVILAGCSMNDARKGMTLEEKMTMADSFYAKKKYARAIQLYQNIVFEKQSAFTATAQMKIGDANYEMNKFVDARLAYEELIRMYPDFRDVKWAYYRVGVCFWEESLAAQYTQEETKKCIDALSVFLERYPSDELRQDALNYIQKAQYKLLEKHYYNGYIYYKMQDYSGALMYLKEIIDLGNVNHVDKMSLYYASLCYLKQSNWSEAKSTLQKMQTRYPDSKETKRIQKRVARITDKQ